MKLLPLQVHSHMQVQLLWTLQRCMNYSFRRQWELWVLSATSEGKKKNHVTFFKGLKYIWMPKFKHLTFENDGLVHFSDLIRVFRLLFLTMYIYSKYLPWSFVSEYRCAWMDTCVQCVARYRQEGGPNQRARLVSYIYISPRSCLL